MYQNYLKDYIISNAYACIQYSVPSQPVCALELGCGKGGDVHKFYHSNFNFVCGVDLSDADITEAERRFRASYVNKPVQRGKPFCAEFHVCDLSRKNFDCPFLVDVVTLNFALNYFFESPDTLRQLFRNVSYSLKTGGQFIGIAINNKRLNELRKNALLFKGNRYTVVFDQPDDRSRYTFTFTKLDNTVEQFTEYPVDFKDLEQCAVDYGFRVDEDSITELNEENDKLSLCYINFLFRFEKTKDIYARCSDDNNNNNKEQKHVYKYEYFIQHPNLEFFFDINELVLSSDAILSNTSKITSIELVKIVQDHALSSIKDKTVLFNFIDAFAYCGAESIAVALYIPSLHVVSVENDAANIAAIQRNAKLYEVENVFAFNGTLQRALFTVPYTHEATILYLNVMFDQSLHETVFTILDTYRKKTVAANKIMFYIVKVPNAYEFDALVYKDVFQDLVIMNEFECIHFKFVLFGLKSLFQSR